MVDHGTVRSAEKPDAMVIDDYSVWVHSDISEVTMTDEEGNERTEYEFKMIQYTKDEFIASQADDITDLQLALTELYEMI